MKTLDLFAHPVLIASAWAIAGASLAACPPDASSLASSIKVRDAGVLGALGEPIPGQIQKAGGVDRYIAAIEALSLEASQQRDQWKKAAQGSYGGGGDALAWPNGCSWPAAGTYCNALAVYQMNVDALVIYDFYGSAASCYRGEGMR